METKENKLYELYEFNSKQLFMAREDSKERYIPRDQRFSEGDIARESFLQGINIHEHLR